MDNQSIGALLKGSLALNTGSDVHTLDHIAPLAAILQIPLATTEEDPHQLALHYYPQIEHRYFPDLEFRLEEIAEEFDALFECKYWAAHLRALFRQLYKKEMPLIFCPHGQSDKGFEAPLLAPYALQDGVLLYGDLLIEMLKILGVWSAIPPFARVGNYRRLFYEKHRSFYDELAIKALPLDRSKRTLLYAPTWNDAEGSTSFFQYGKKLIAELPTDWNLMVKLHPLLERRDPAQFYSIASLIERKQNAYLIDRFPPVYPILSLADLYLGDASSVGYDFLSFQKPLYFFPSNVPKRLHSCGKVIDPQKELYSQLSIENPFRENQARLYEFAFGFRQTEEFLRGQIGDLLARLQNP